MDRRTALPLRGKVWHFPCRQKHRSAHHIDTRRERHKPRSNKIAAQSCCQLHNLRPILRHLDLHMGGRIFNTDGPDRLHRHFPYPLLRFLIQPARLTVCQLHKIGRRRDKLVRNREDMRFALYHHNFHADLRAVHVFLHHNRAISGISPAVVVYRPIICRHSFRTLFACKRLILQLLPLMHFIIHMHHATAPRIVRRLHDAIPFQLVHRLGKRLVIRSRIVFRYRHPAFL